MYRGSNILHKLDNLRVVVQWSQLLHSVCTSLTICFVSLSKIVTLLRTRFCPYYVSKIIEHIL